jgi:hypothetical protein
MSIVMDKLCPLWAQVKLKSNVWVSFCPAGLEFIAGRLSC